MVESVVLLDGDCIAAMADMPEASVDSIVTDPPYELGFMGRKWDASGIAFDPETWAAALRVLKPGGHLVAFGAPKNYHRLACAIEDAGFEIRDSLMWVFGSGFPKSHNLDGEWQGWGTALKPAYEPIILARKPLIGTVAENVLAHGTGALNIDACRVGDFVNTTPPGTDRYNRANFEQGYRPNAYQRLDVTGQRPYVLQSWEQEPRLCASCAALAADPVKQATPETRESTATKPVGPITSDEEKSSQDATDSGAIGCSDGTRPDATSTNSSTSKCGKTPTDQYQTGTKSTTETETRATTNSTTCSSCLKPITDDCTPSSMSGETSGWPQAGTRHAPIGRDGEPSANKAYAKNGSTNFAATPGPRGGSPAGRWPANLVHDGSEEVLAAFPDRKGAVSNGRSGEKGVGDWGMGPVAQAPGYADSGSAARFFYCAKAGKNDRAGSKHPTVKPIALMRWLVRLITPPGGVVLDPFAGSGTTGQAAMEEGFSAILIEREEEYVMDISRRIQSTPKQETMAL